MCAFPNLEPVHCSMSNSNWCFSTCIQVSQEADKVVWYSHLFQKFSTVCCDPQVKVFVWITKNCGKFWKRWEYQTTWPASWEICMQVKKQQLELDMEQQTGSKLGKEYIKAVYCHPAYLTYMQSTSWEMLGWMKQKLESGLPWEISINLRYADDTTLI